jgi:hypothetical protein
LREKLANLDLAENHRPGRLDLLRNVSGISADTANES